jgi:hypothetical protein
MPRRCIRDERGWLVPAKGTMARTVYDVLVAAEQCEEEFKAAVLAGFLGTSANTVQATAWRIRRGSNQIRCSRRRAQPGFSGLHKAIAMSKSYVDKVYVAHSDDKRLCCAQCRIKMTLSTAEPDPRRSDKELHTYVCGCCGLREIIEMPL